MLPTIWSNCLTGWLLAGGGSWATLLQLALGITCVFLGGAYLNDAFDAEHDRQFRKERPVPSGAIGIDDVWRWGFGWLGAGTLLLVFLSNACGALASLLLFSVLLYDAVHKLVAFAPLLMGASRFLLYAVAAAAGADGLQGAAIWGGLGLTVYVTGLGYLARHERSKIALPAWPAWLLAAPILLAVPANTGPHLLSALCLSLMLGLWVLRSLRPAFWAENRHVGRAVSDLLAGIVLVDLLALAGGGTVWMALLYLALFVLAVALQRVAP